MSELLRVSDLHVTYRTRTGPLPAVRGMNFALAEGEALGVIGESGCGKSTLVKALMRLLPAGSVTTGSVLLKEHDLQRISAEALRQIRWERLALVPQSSMNSLDPVYQVGDQIVEAIQAHRKVGHAEAWTRAGALLDMVGVPAERLKSFPHQLSGGTRQRVCIAMAMALEPELLVADEPTTALDVITQQRILFELRRLQTERGVTVLLISHDIALVSEQCDRVLVMYGGVAVEVGPVSAVLHNTAHPYTAGLLQSYPRLTGPRQILSIPGRPPDMRALPAGCIFAPRCPLATSICRSEDPSLVEISPGHLAACHHAADPAMMERKTWSDFSAQLEKGGIPIG